MIAFEIIKLTFGQPFNLGVTRILGTGVVRGDASTTVILTLGGNIVRQGQGASKYEALST
jgi:hypothetical protein